MGRKGGRFEAKSAISFFPIRPFSVISFCSADGGTIHRVRARSFLHFCGVQRTEKRRRDNEAGVPTEYLIRTWPERARANRYGTSTKRALGYFLTFEKKKRKEKERRKEEKKEKERKDGKEKKKLFVFLCRVPLWTAYLFVLVDFLLFVEESRRYWRAIFVRQSRDQLLPCLMTAREWENTRHARDM